MPLAGVGVALGKKAIEKVADAVGDAAVDAVKAPRAGSSKIKKSGKVRSNRKAGRAILLVAGAILLILLLSHGHLVR